ncbi:MAG: hypothetical protein SCK28_10795 [Bacillota bacterium]|nr:hypothetical protein [Bacillota bacterium]
MELTIARGFDKFVVQVKHLYSKLGLAMKHEQPKLEADSWLDYKLENIWEIEENNILQHYERLGVD